LIESYTPGVRRRFLEKTGVAGKNIIWRIDFMKRLIMVMFVITIGTGLYAQNSFFPSKAGMVLTYAQNDARGNAQGYSVLTIKDVKGSGRNMTITYGLNVLDKNRKPLTNAPGEMTYQVVIKDGVVIMDMNQMIPAQLKDQGVRQKLQARRWNCQVTCSPVSRSRLPR